MNSRESVNLVENFDGKMGFDKDPRCGNCHSKGDDDNPLLFCIRCQIGRYCSKECQIEDFSRHRSPCRKVAELRNLLPKLEENFKDFDLYELVIGQDDLNQDLSGFNADEINSKTLENVKFGRQNLFKTMMGRFSELSNRNVFQPMSKNPEDIWPRDYLILKMRLCEDMWKIAERHECVETVEEILEMLIDLIKLDTQDICMAVPMAAFMLLYLDRIDDSYNFIKFWIKRYENEALGKLPIILDEFSDV